MHSFYFLNFAINTEEWLYRFIVNKKDSPAIQFTKLCIEGFVLFANTISEMLNFNPEKEGRHIVRNKMKKIKIQC